MQSQPPSESAAPAAIYTNANVASSVPAPDTSINDIQVLNAELATKSAVSLQSVYHIISVAMCKPTICLAHQYT